MCVWFVVSVASTPIHQFCSDNRVFRSRAMSAMDPNLIASKYHASPGLAVASPLGLTIVVESNGTRIIIMRGNVHNFTPLFKPFENKQLFHHSRPS